MILLSNNSIRNIFINELMFRRVNNLDECCHKQCYILQINAVNTDQIHPD